MTRPILAGQAWNPDPGLMPSWEQGALSSLSMRSAERRPWGVSPVLLRCHTEPPTDAAPGKSPPVGKAPPLPFLSSVLQARFLKIPSLAFRGLGQEESSDQGT